MGVPQVGEIRLKPNTGFQIQHAVLKELGYPKLKTLKDFENAIKTYIDKHPTIDGKPAIGLSLLADDWRIKISTTNPALFATGGSDDGEWYYDTDTKKAMLHLRRSEEREYFRWLNHMNDIGLLDPESFIQKYDKYQAKIAEGRVIGLADAPWEYDQAAQALVGAGKSERAYAILPLVLNDDYKYADFRPVEYTGGYGVGITTKCKDPVRAIRFLDWMCTDEAQILRSWGIEGVHYDIVDGKRKFKDDVFKQWTTDPNFGRKTGVGLYWWPWPGYGLGKKDKNGDYYAPVFKQTIIDSYTDADRETLKAYGVEMYKDLFPSENEFEPAPYGELWKINIPSGTDASVIFRKYDDITAKKVAEAVLAEPKDFDKVWDEYMGELDKIGCDKLEEEFNKILRSLDELWK